SIRGVELPRTAPADRLRPVVPLAPSRHRRCLATSSAILQRHGLAPARRAPAQTMATGERLRIEDHVPSPPDRGKGAGGLSRPCPLYRDSGTPPLTWAFAILGQPNCPTPSEMRPDLGFCPGTVLLGQWDTRSCPQARRWLF